MIHVYIETDAYSASALPDNHPERGSYELTLRRVEGDKWGVTRYGRWWDHEGNSEFLGGGVRTDRDVERFLMRLTEAITVARMVAPTLTVNGHPVSEVLEGQG